MQYRHTREFDLRWTDYDFQDIVSPTCILELAEEVAGSSADELGFGYDELNPKRLGFIIVGTYCEFKKTPLRLSHCTVETWPLPPRHVIFERDYRITSGEEEIALLASRWALVDLDTFALKSASSLGEAHERCPYRAERCVEVANWKIQKLAGTGRLVHKAAVEVSDCDHYLHANNTRYARFFFDCFTMDELRLRAVKSFQISYIKQARAGDELCFYRKDEGETSTLEAMCGEELISQCRIVFRQE